MKKGGVLVAVALVGVLALGGVAFATHKKAKIQQATRATPVISGPDKNLPAVQVGMVSSYAPVNYNSGGEIDYAYLAPDWVYANVAKDW